MTNVFQLTYDSRLRSWCELRKSIEDKDTATKCIEIDRWWQSAPLVSHYLAHTDIASWPGPWDLLAENHYCYIARGLGMIYTLLLTGIKDIDFCIAMNDNSEESALVLVDRANYVMNYWPGSVLNTSLTEFNITGSITIDDIKKKI